MTPSTLTAPPPHLELRQRPTFGFGMGALIFLVGTVTSLGLAVLGAVIGGVGVGIVGAAIGLAGVIVFLRTGLERLRARRARALPTIRLAGDQLTIPRERAGEVTLDLRAPYAIHTRYLHRPASPATNTPASTSTVLELQQGDIKARVFATEHIARATLEKLGVLGHAPAAATPDDLGIGISLEDLLVLYRAVARRQV